MKPVAAETKPAAAKEQSEFSKKAGLAMTAVKKKMAEMEEKRRAAKAAEAERARLLARQQEAMKAEAERLAEEAARKAEYDAKLEEAVNAELAAAKNTSRKKVVKPQKSIKQASTGKIDNSGKTLKEKNISQYKLLNEYNFSRGILDNLKHNRSITMSTLNQLCEMFDCEIANIIEYKKDK